MKISYNDINLLKIKAMSVLLFFISCFVYLVIGKIVALVLTHFGKMNPDNTDYPFEAFIVTVFFPIVVICVSVNWTAKQIFKIFIKTAGHE
jgi:hypothetical protein